MITITGKDLEIWKLLLQVWYYIRHRRRIPRSHLQPSKLFRHSYTNGSATKKPPKR